MRIIVNDTISNKMYFNGIPFWSVGSLVPDEVPFYVEDISGSSNTFSVIKSNDNAPTLTIEKSLDMAHWESMGTTSTTAITAEIPANGKLFIRCKTNNWSNRTELVTNSIKISGRCNIGGNIMSLLYGDDFTGRERSFPSLDESYIFSHLFYDQTNIISSENLLLPATTTASYCYTSMFNRCWSMTASPLVLPATTLAFSCYLSMFHDCRALTTAPVLPATTLEQRCYYRMFMNCQSLTKAPELLASDATKDLCYCDMFSGCRSLNEIRCLATGISDRGQRQWVNGVSATGTFYKKAGVEWPTGTSGIPEGWTVVEV